MHAFTHPSLVRLAPWQRSLGLRETQLAVVGATGVATALLRPPFSSRNDALNDCLRDVEACSEPELKQETYAATEVKALLLRLAGVRPPLPEAGSVGLSVAWLNYRPRPHPQRDSLSMFSPGSRLQSYGL
ncbi:hypothetical protein R6V09_49585 [Streptomyces sp. W16]|uniref:hypothetical protein n=1 Tax=Streptomyces sp. W16 TaxID=3076631 RepID=UPI00295A58F8|nr:hypothetical protein [Streptomyces sp. W16]MDV9178163.1 hypothetical protein [Streptomyces sp. W16]